MRTFVFLLASEYRREAAKIQPPKPTRMRFGTSCKYGNTLGLQQSSETQLSPFQTTSIVPSNHKRQI
ncbi:hypothetical protein NEISICOT_01873 [Neisseria sicca ATCC 29256]|uniref:Uncharacterized protein n=1 Tax=Neisseria sicca ATCC 29256 TaxID=547045 RepID=C6M5S5_NEISI|nr:hypothetical protein NEISICOT_01873 [Neisseria sicca ATCC 29256]